MRKLVRQGNVLAFSLGLLISHILPQSWLVIVIALVLAVTAFIGSRCCKC